MNASKMLAGIRSLCERRQNTVIALAVPSSESAALLCFPDAPSKSDIDRQLTYLRDGCRNLPVSISFVLRFCDPKDLRKSMDAHPLVSGPRRDIFSGNLWPVLQAGETDPVVRIFLAPLETGAVTPEQRQEYAISVYSGSVECGRTYGPTQDNDFSFLSVNNSFVDAWALHEVHGPRYVQTKTTDAP